MRFLLVISAVLLVGVIAHAQSTAVGEASTCPPAVTCPEHQQCTCNPEGHLVRQERRNDAGVVVWRQANSYDADGARILEEHDFDADGSVDVRRSFDGAGNLTVEELDLDDDGELDGRDTHSYDDRGNVLSRDRDRGADGSLEERVIYTYDADGNRTTWMVDQDADGTTDTGCTYSPPCPPPFPFEQCLQQCTPYPPPPAGAQAASDESQTSGYAASLPDSATDEVRELAARCDADDYLACAQFVLRCRSGDGMPTNYALCDPVFMEIVDACDFEDDEQACEAARQLE